MKNIFCCSTFFVFKDSWSSPSSSAWPNNRTSIFHRPWINPRLFLKRPIQTEKWARPKSGRVTPDSNRYFNARNVECISHKFVRECLEGLIVWRFERGLVSRYFSRANLAQSGKLDSTPGQKLLRRKPKTRNKRRIQAPVWKHTRTPFMTYHNAGMNARVDATLWKRGYLNEISARWCL